MSGSGADIGSITLEPPGTFEGNDNQFSPTAPFLDSNGVSFDTTDLGIVNLYRVMGSDYSTGNPTIGDNVGSLAVTAAPTGVPEPFTLGLFGTGLAALFLMRRRAKTLAS